MSATYYLIKDKKAKSPYFNMVQRLDYTKWVEVMEEYEITWDKDTKHGKYYIEKDPEFYYKRQAYFDYIESEANFINEENGQVIKTGEYSFFIIYEQERGLSWIQFYNRERKKFLPLFFEISQKLDCYLMKNSRKVITQEYIDSL